MRRFLLTMGLVALVSSALAEDQDMTIPFVNCRESTVLESFRDQRFEAINDLDSDDGVLVDFSTDPDGEIHYSYETRQLSVFVDHVRIYSQKLAIDKNFRLYSADRSIMMSYEFNGQTITRRIALDEKLLEKKVVGFRYGDQLTSEFQPQVYAFCNSVYTKELFKPTIAISSKK